MTEIKPRFEFRTFARGLGSVERRFRELSALGGIRESSEIYIVSKGNNENNTKVRDALMDIKVFVREDRGLEQWNPRMKGAFPMEASTLQRDVIPAFEVEVPELTRDVYTLENYLSEVIEPHPDLQAVRVHKRRFAFTINDCIAELGDIYINGAKIQTANLESVDVEAILDGMRMVGLADYENINYLMAIKRVIGMEKGSIPW